MSTHERLKNDRKQRFSYTTTSEEVIIRSPSPCHYKVSCFQWFIKPESAFFGKERMSEHMLEERGGAALLSLTYPLLLENVRKRAYFSSNSLIMVLLAGYYLVEGAA